MSVETVREFDGLKIISSFSEKYQFLGNFFSAKVVYEGIEYDNSEAAFQAAKTKNLTLRKEFSTLNPSQAKKKGRHIPLREDWEEIKNQVMYEIVKDKFSRNLELKEKLLATDNAILVEGNWWHDNYWGACNCERCATKTGENNLGKILMRVRRELKNEQR